MLQDSRVGHMPLAWLWRPSPSERQLGGKQVSTSQETGLGICLEVGAGLKVTRLGSFCTWALLTRWMEKQLCSLGPAVQDLSETFVN